MKTTNVRLGKIGPIVAGNRQNCTHPVPKNKFGIVDMHCIANQPISRSDAKKIFEGPIAAIEADYQAEISAPADFTKCMKEFDPLGVLLKCRAPLPEKTKVII